MLQPYMVIDYFRKKYLRHSIIECAAGEGVIEGSWQYKWVYCGIGEVKRVYEQGMLCLSPTLDTTWIRWYMTQQSCYIVVVIFVNLVQSNIVVSKILLVGNCS